MESESQIRFVDLDGDIETVASELVRAFEEIGFCYISNNSISSELVNSCFVDSKEFFSLSESDKLRHALTYGVGEPFFGYIPGKPQGNVSVDSYSTKSIEYRESLIAVEYMEEYKWPVVPSAPNFRHNLCDLLSASHELFRRLARILGKGLELSDPELLVNALQKMGKRGNLSCVRENYYPAVDDVTQFSEYTRFGEHTDFGFLTMAFQRPCDYGLEVCTKSGQFISASAKPGCVLVFLGDSLQRLTSDRLCAALHRVSLKPDDDGSKQARERLTITCFAKFDDEFLIESDKYPPVTSIDYINMCFKKGFEKPNNYIYTELRNQP